MSVEPRDKPAWEQAKAEIVLVIRDVKEFYHRMAVKRQKEILPSIDMEERRKRAFPSGS